MPDPRTNTAKRRQQRARAKARQSSVDSKRSQRILAKQRRRAREANELLLMCKRENSEFIYHPPLELLPRVVPNALQDPMHEAERRVIEQANALGLACEYEPFLFQMFDSEYGCRIATSPDLWFPTLGLVVEIGYVPNKSRKVRNLRESFPRMSFGVVSTRSAMSMPQFEDQTSFLQWLLDEVESCNEQLAHMKSAEVAGEAYRRAIAEGATPAQAAAQAKSALRRL